MLCQINAGQACSKNKLLKLSLWKDVQLFILFFLIWRTQVLLREITNTLFWSFAFEIRGRSSVSLACFLTCSGFLRFTSGVTRTDCSGQHDSSAFLAHIIADVFTSIGGAQTHDRTYRSTTLLTIQPLRLGHLCILDVHANFNDTFAVFVTCHFQGHEEYCLL